MNLARHWMHTARVSVITLIVLPIVSWAGPWAEPGDVRLRHDIQLIADAGLLSAPITAWPLSFGDLAAGLRDPSVGETFSPAVHTALTRIKSRLRQEAQAGFSSPHFSISFAHEPIRLRTFDDTPREEAELTSGVEWMGERFAFQLRSTLVADPEDDKRLRFDGSYGGMALGNWMLSVGAMPRWWGPGWDGSLILGTAARPVPALSIERNVSTPFDLPVLKWLGPWKLTAFLGQLEQDRDFAEAKLLGMRVNFKPTDKLEIGLSRTAQWGGEGRPEDFDSFIDLILGNDNTGDDITVDNQPGNQLAGIDFRWHSPLVGQFPYAIYGQLIGEDESGGLPSRSIGQLGFEHWRSVDAWNGSYRLYAEYADTAANFYDDSPRYNYTYEHLVYQDGYRYRSLPLGHAIDNDSRMYSLGLIWAENNGLLWGAQLQYTELNRDGMDDWAGNSLSPGIQTDLVRIFATHRRDMFAGRLTVGVGAERIEAEQGDHSTEGQAYVKWSTGW